MGVETVLALIYAEVLNFKDIQLGASPLAVEHFRHLAVSRDLAVLHGTGIFAGYEILELELVLNFKDILLGASLLAALH